MSMKPEEIAPILEETIQLARVVCPQDNLCSPDRYCRSAVPLVLGPVGQR